MNGKKYTIVLNVVDKDQEHIVIDCDWYMPDWIVHNYTGHTELSFVAIDEENDSITIIPYSQIMFTKQNYEGKKTMKKLSKMMREEQEKNIEAMTKTKQTENRAFG